MVKFIIKPLNNCHVNKLMPVQGFALHSHVQTANCPYRSRNLVLIIIIIIIYFIQAQQMEDDLRKIHICYRIISTFDIF